MDETAATWRILSLSNCTLDPTLGSGKTRLRWQDGLRSRGFTVDFVEPSALLRSIPRAGGVRFGLALGALLNADVKGYDAVEFYGGEFGLITGWLQSKKPRPLLIAHTDGLELLQSERMKSLRTPGLKSRLMAPLHRGLDHLAFANADVLIAGCGADVDFAKKQGLFPEDSAVCINVGVDPEYLGIPFRADKEHLVTYFGTWSPRKAPERISRVMSRVLDKDESCRFQVLGASGADKEIFESFPARQRSRIIVHPKLPSGEVAEQLLRSKVMFFPSHYEGFGMATSEAMACSCAVVVTPTGFGADLVDGFDAFVPAFEDEARMEKNILQLLSDHELRTRMAQAGWKRVQGLGWNKQCDKLASAYRDYLSRWDAAEAVLRNA